MGKRSVKSGHSHVALVNGVTGTPLYISGIWCFPSASIFLFVAGDTHRQRRWSITGSPSSVSSSIGREGGSGPCGLAAADWVLPEKFQQC